MKSKRVIPSSESEISSPSSEDLTKSFNEYMEKEEQLTQNLNPSIRNKISAPKDFVPSVTNNKTKGQRKYHIEYNFLNKSVNLESTVSEIF